MINLIIYVLFGILTALWMRGMFRQPIPFIILLGCFITGYIGFGILILCFAGSYFNSWLKSIKYKYK